MFASVRPLFGSLLIQGIIAVCAFATLAALSLRHTETFGLLYGRASEVEEVAIIGIEHDAPVSLRFVLGRKDEAGYLKITGDPAHPVLISLPEAWRRTAVHGASLADVAAEDPALGFVRRTLPPGAGISLELPSFPAGLGFVSPTDAVARIVIDRVDVTSGETARDILLVQREGEISL